METRAPALELFVKRITPEESVTKFWTIPELFVIPTPLMVRVKPVRVMV